jgi:hypothetical protein
LATNQSVLAGSGSRAAIGPQNPASKTIGSHCFITANLLVGLIGGVRTAVDSIIPLGKRQCGDPERPRENDLFDSNVAATTGPKAQPFIQRRAKPWYIRRTACYIVRGKKWPRFVAQFCRRMGFSPSEFAADGLKPILQFCPSYFRADP